MWKLDGRTILQDAPFWHNGIQYPANWITMSSQADKDVIGLVWVTPDPRPDDHYYYVQDNGDGTYTSTPKDLAECQTRDLNAVKVMANSLLAPTDWYVVRFADIGTPVPADVSAYRSEVRSFSGLNEAAILACTTVEELAVLTPTWPSYASPTATPFGSTP